MILASLSLFSCSDEPEEEDMSGPNLEVFEGRYRGNWTWEFGTGAISMVIQLQQDNLHRVDFYETANFKPMFNSDGVTPEKVGTIRLDGNTITELDLTLDTDSPSCNGNTTGMGSWNGMGILILNVDVVHDCAEDAPAKFTLSKIEDL